MPEFKIPDIDTDLTRAARDIAAVAKDATYVVIGAGVLGFQQVQVQRQELLKRLVGQKVEMVWRGQDGRVGDKEQHQAKKAAQRGFEFSHVKSTHSQDIGPYSNAS